MHILCSYAEGYQRKENTGRDKDRCSFALSGIIVHPDQKITADDRDALQDMIHSDIIYRYEPTYLLEQQYTDTDRLIHDLYGGYFEKKQNLFLGIFLKDHPSELCGLTEFYDYRDHLHMVSIGVRLREKFWKSGDRH